MGKFGVDVTIYVSLLWICHMTHSGADQPPSILEGPQNIYVYRRDQSIQLPCTASGSPKPTYEWLKNGKILNLNLPNIQRQGEGGIKISDGGTLDVGYYQCIASNQHGRALSNVTFLQLAILDSPSASEPIEIAVQEGEPFHLDFLPPKSVPRAQYRWATTDSLNSKEQTELSKSKRVQWAENGSLFFSYATKEDSLNGRIYKGLAFNPHMDVTAGGSYTKVKVIPTQGGLKRFPPKIAFASDRQTIGLEGENVTLYCFFSSYPDSKTMWRGPNNVLPPGRYIIESYETELKLLNLRQTDAGEYTCTGSNSEGTLSYKIDLIVQAVPKFNSSFLGPQNTNITEGEDVTYSCNPYAKPRADTAWMIDGTPLSFDNLPPRVSISSDRRRLTVHSTCQHCKDRSSFSDLMVIQCNASNEYGYAFGSGYLNVLKKTTVVLDGDSKVSIYNNEQRTIQFQCFATADPETPAHVRWFRLLDDDERPVLVHSEAPVVIVSNGALMINVSENMTSRWDKYGGRYKCIADNGYSQAEVEVEIQVKHAEPFAEPPKVADFPWWIFVIAAVVLLLLILILFCCICIFRNRGDKYDVDGKERKNGNDPVKELDASGFHDYQRREIEPFKGSQNSLGSSARLFGDDEPSEVGDQSRFLENGSYHSMNTVDRKKGRSEYI